MAGCVMPIRITHGDHSSMVRCGRCRYCRVRRKQQWVGRLRMEELDHVASRFVTLTYREDPGLLQVRDLQTFMKRYRYHYGECRFFGVGEYGEKGGRGHWHLIIFGHAPESKGHWQSNKAWDAGYSFDGTVTKESIGYVAGYTLKDLEVVARRPITRMSLRPGLGFDRLEKLGAALAYRFQDVQLPSWPAFFHIGTRKYPLCDGGLVAVKRGFLNSGGFAPPQQTPDERHVLTLEALADLGTRIEQERLHSSMFKHLRGDDNGVQKKRSANS